MSTWIRVGDKSIETVTVAELREMLEMHDDSAPVLFSCNYGDYGKTMQALPLLEAETLDVVESAYSESGLALVDSDRDEDSDEDSDDEPTASAVVLYAAR